MKKLVLLLCLVLSSCYVQELPEGPINNTGPIIITPPNNGGVITTQTLVGQTWRIFYYRVGPMGTVMSANDTQPVMAVCVKAFAGSVCRRKQRADHRSIYF